MDTTDRDPDHVEPAMLLAVQSGNEGKSIYGALETAAEPEQDEGIEPCPTDC